MQRPKTTRICSAWCAADRKRLETIRAKLGRAPETVALRFAIAQTHRHMAAGGKVDRPDRSGDGELQKLYIPVNDEELQAFVEITERGGFESVREAAAAMIRWTEELVKGW